MTRRPLLAVVLPVTIGPAAAPPVGTSQPIAGRPSLVEPQPGTGPGTTIGCVVATAQPAVSGPAEQIAVTADVVDDGSAPAAPCVAATWAAGPLRPHLPGGAG